jgi:hypothetical protein
MERRDARAGPSLQCPRPSVVIHGLVHLSETSVLDLRLLSIDPDHS